MSERKKRTITMTDRRPIKIVEDDWPVIAIAKWCSNYPECQANEEAAIRVREHSDGRRVVYGARDSGPGGMRIGYTGTHAGYLLDAPSDDTATIKAIHDVAAEIGMEELGQQCIQDMPAQEV